jgi:hypothetical protein
MKSASRSDPAMSRAKPRLAAAWLGERDRQARSVGAVNGDSHRHRGALQQFAARDFRACRAACDHGCGDQRLEALEQIRMRRQGGGGEPQYQISVAEGLADPADAFAPVQHPGPHGGLPPLELTKMAGTRYADGANCAHNCYSSDRRRAANAAVVGFDEPSLLKNRLAGLAPVGQELIKTLVG